VGSILLLPHGRALVMPAAASLLEVQGSGERTMPPQPVGVEIRPITRDDAPRWEGLRCALWPGHDAEHRQEIAAFFAGALPEPAAVLEAENEEGRMLAFAEFSIRDDLTELQGRRAGYVEGLYVIPEARNRGIARKLLQASRDWVRGQGCVALASDRADRIIVDRHFQPSAERD